MINKKELIQTVVSKNKLSTVKASEVVETILDTITTALINNQEVELKGIGKLKVSERKARTGVNPLTKEKITIPASKAISFKASKTIKEKLNG